MLDQTETLTGFCDPSESRSVHEMLSSDAPRRGLISEVSYVGGTIVRLTWSGGISDEFDLLPALLAARVHDRLAVSRELFGTIRVGIHGSVLEWADGTILPARSVATLAELRMSNSEFKDAMSLLGLSYAAMAAHLGVSERQVGNFRRDKPVPNYIALAVRHLLRLRIERYNEQPLA